MPFNQPVFIMLVSVLGALGLLVSTVAGLIAGVRPPDVILRPLISSIIMASLGVGVYFILQQQTPDLLSTVNEEENSYSGTISQKNEMSYMDPKDEGEGEGDIKQDSLETTNSMSDMAGGSSLGESQKHDDDGTLLSRSSRSVAKQSSVSGDTLVVEGVPLENKPKLMAQAIQHLLDQEDDDG